MAQNAHQAVKEPISPLGLSLHTLAYVYCSLAADSVTMATPSPPFVIYYLINMQFVYADGKTKCLFSCNWRILVYLYMSRLSPV